MKHTRRRILVTLHLSQESLAPEIKAAETTWGFPHKAFEAGLNVNSETFQLISPFTSWDWPSASPGHLASSEFAFVSTVPEWSGTGAYAAGGGRLSDTYEFFLMALCSPRIRSRSRRSKSGRMSAWTCAIRCSAAPRRTPVRRTPPTRPS